MAGRQMNKYKHNYNRKVQYNIEQDNNNDNMTIQYVHYWVGVGVVTGQYFYVCLIHRPG